MQVSRHISLTGEALRRWFIAQCYDSLAVGALWLAGLWYLHLPFAPFWAVLAAGLQFIPHFGPVLAFFGPALAALLTDGFEGVLYVLVLYGIVIVTDGLILQPLIMRRTARVPVWASLIVPILLSLFFGFWGWLLAAPLLAVIFAYRAHIKSREQAPVRRQTPPGQVITGGQLISPGGSSDASRSNSR
jgi:predicted PurR-regulated permease PerM